MKISARFWTLKNFQIWPNFFAKSAHFFPKTEVFLLNPAIRFPPPGGARCCPCEACQFAFWQPFCHMLPDWRFHRGRQQFAALRRYYFRIGPHIEFSCRLAQTWTPWISELFCFLVSHKLGLPGFLRFVLSWSRTNLGFLDFWDPRLYQNVSVKGVDCVHALSKEVLNRRGITRRQLTARSRAHASIRAR